MPTEIKLWQIEDDTPKSVSQNKLDLESRLEDWLRRDIGLVNDDLLVIGQQAPTDHTGDIDLLAIDSNANLVILELKRDKTPRDIVAQILDYASYVKNLGLSDIQGIASNSEFLGGKSLEEAFSERFGSDLPEFVNQAHRMYIVASSLDPATERIVGYLSENYGVDINVATFGYFKSGNEEFVGRSMLIDEEVVQVRAESRSASRRRRVPTQAELQAIAMKRGVGELWKKAADEFRPISQRRARSGSSLFFQVRLDSGYRMFISMFPDESSQEDGLAISLGYDTLFQAFNLTEDEVKDTCGLSENLFLADVGTGSTYFFDAERLDRLIQLLKQNAPRA